ncbi:ribonuclease H-like domain-containing protein [Tanacetum coccineum]
MLNCNPTQTLIDTESMLGPEGTPISDPTLYRNLAGGLQYLTFTRLDLSYVVQQIFICILNLLFEHTLTLIKSGCPATRRSTSRYYGVANVVAETAWLQNLLRELDTSLVTAILVYYDNVSAVYLSTISVQHQRTKHIEIDIHFVRDMVAMGYVRVIHVFSRYEYANIFTKGLPSALFQEFRTSLSVRLPPAQNAGEC